MDGKVKQGRRCRSKRERVRRLREAGSRDVRSPDPNSSCSDREGHSPGRDAASLPAKKAPHPAAAGRAPRPPRRKRRESSSQEEDIIDGFAIASFTSLDRLEKKSGVVKAQEKKERWKEKKVAKRQKKDEQEATAEEEENVQPAVDPLENGFLHHAEREQERMNERLLKKTYSKKNKMIKPLSIRPVKVSEGEAVQELSRPHRSASKEQLSEVSSPGTTFHLSNAPPPPPLLSSPGRVGLSGFIKQWGGPLRWDRESRQTTTAGRMRSEAGRSCSSCGFQQSAHKSCDASRPAGSE